MEEIRRRMIDMQPEPVAGKGRRIPSVAQSPQSDISISSASSASTSSTTGSTTSTEQSNGILHLSDSDEEVQDIKAPPPRTTVTNPPLRTALENVVKNRIGPAQPIHIPSNRDIPRPAPKAPEADTPWETFDVGNVDVVYDPKKSSLDAEKDLKDLFQQSFDGHEDDKDGVALDMSESIVEGFRDGITLLPHQVIGRRWMRERETGKKLGGILADDMGLGKTIQTLTRIVEGRPRKSDERDGWNPCTLVVCPVSLVGQWAAEIRKMAVGMSVIEHHGPSRTTNPDQFKRANVVVTSYSIVASEFGAYKPDAKDEGKNKSKKKTSKSDDGSSDEEQFGRTIKTTKKKGAAPKKKDALFRIRWWRIVLDEAHTIKNRNTLAAKACCALEGKYRWCLTGTPLQNNVEELYSLVAFLRIRPLNDWPTFNEQIVKPVKSGKTARPMKRLHVVLKAIMLRRKKTDTLNGKPLLELPKRHLAIVPCEFDPEERAFYVGLEQRIEAVMQKLAKSGDLSKSYTSVLVLLLRLRQACDHPALVSQDYNKDKDAVQPQASKKDENDSDSEADDLADMLGQMGLERTCQVCQTSLTKGNMSPDSEEHCEECAPIANNARRKSIAKRADSNLPPDSAKIRKILELLEDIADRSDKDGNPNGEKTIIFSQFTSMLDILEIFLKDAQVKYVRYDGSMSKDKREASLEKIRTSKSTTVILISFKAGSTGLNLTSCNNVILVDMWWNPALEDQAFDRAHRFGQQRDVNIYKLTIEQTVEERILDLQNTKRALADAALSGDKLKNSKLGMDDLLALFRPGRDDDDDDD